MAAIPFTGQEILVALTQKVYQLILQVLLILLAGVVAETEESSRS
jgi:hypothetical protein